MPSRPVTIAIVAFWLLTAGWFVARDVLPHWRTGDPPPYTIQLADEALRQVVAQRWVCTLNDQKVGTIKTALIYRPEDDTFELSATSQELTFDRTILGVPISVQARPFEDVLRVNRDGELRAMRTAANLALTAPGVDVAGRFELTGEVRGGRFWQRMLLEAPVLGTKTAALPPADPPRGSVLNPMHPVPRITGLRPGREWRQPLTDTRHQMLQAALDQWTGGRAPRLPAPPDAVLARVLPEPGIVDWNGEAHPCYVIEYRDNEDYVARTWVRVTDGTVMKQEAGGHGEKMVLQRE